MLLRTSGHLFFSFPSAHDALAPGESDNRNQQKMEMKVWDPDNPLTDRQIDQFLVVAR